MTRVIHISCDIMLRFWLLCVFFCFAISVSAQFVGSIGFYNVENLFDTSNDDEINDEDFLPGGENKWSEKRYQSKLNNLSRVINIMAGGPDILGLAEVENRKVLEDLLTRTSLKSHNYQIIHFDSPDRRGIDVALIYKPSIFQPTDIKSIPFESVDPDFKTRDILWVEGVMAGDTIHVAVNHWPSRRGGKADKRIEAAQLLRRNVDRVLAQNDQAKIVLMGDFNDDPNNKSMRKELKAHVKLSPDFLFNTSMPTFKKGYGTLMFNGVMNLFDQIIISQGLLKSKSESIFYKDDSFTIVATEWMLEKNKNGMPLRTFSQGAYKNGFSDHLPVLIQLYK